MWTWAMQYPFGFFLLAALFIIVVGLTIENFVKAYLLVKGVYPKKCDCECVEDDEKYDEED